MLDQLNDAAEKIGGKWIKLNRREHGVIEGELIDCEIRPKTFEGSPVLSRKTGEQRTDWVLTLKVDARDDDDDDGIRKLSLNEAGQRALAAGIKESKAKVQPGSRIKIAVTEDPPGDRDQATYKAQHTPGSPVNDAVFASAGAPDPDPF